MESIGRTVVLLDCCEGIFKPSSLISISTKVKGPVKATKTNLTGCLEGVSEYCRIMFDVMPETGDAFISVVTAAATVQRLNTWAVDDQNLRTIIDGFAKIGPSPSVGVSKMGEAIRAVIPSLTEEQPYIPSKQPSVGAPSGPTTRRKAATLSDYETSENTNSSLAMARYKISIPQRHLATVRKGNHVRIICVLQHRTLSAAGMFDEKAMPPSEVNIGNLVAELIQRENRNCLDERRRQPIDSCDLVVLKLKEDLPTTRAYPVKNVSREVTLRVFEVDEKLIADVFSELSIIHFRLRALRITDIPMKESAANANRAIYEVILFYPADLHQTDEKFMELYNQSNVTEDSIRKGNERDDLTSSQTMYINTLRSLGSRTILEENMISLQWKSTDRKLDVNTLNCSCVHRISPVNPASSPSQCLMKHVTSGKAVLLQSVGLPASLTTHVLLTHGGEVFLHCLHPHQPLQDFPGVSLYSRKVSGLRTKEFVNIVANNTYFPPKHPPVDCNEVPIKGDDGNYQTTKSIERITRHFPILESQTLLMDPDMADDFKRLIEPLKMYLFRDETDLETDNDAVELTARIWMLASHNDSRLFPQFASNPSVRQDHYRRLWAEIFSVAMKCGKRRFANQMEVLSKSTPTNAILDSIAKGSSSFKQNNNNNNNNNNYEGAGNRMVGQSQKRKLEASEETQPKKATTEAPSVFQLYWNHQHIKNTSRPEFDGLLVKK